MMIGVYYYPEQWPENQWKRDIENIKSHGMHHIHLAEFSWIHLEPQEGVFNFDWLDRAIELAAANDLGVILCTPTATPPVWMSKHYPEILMVKENLAQVTHGSRAHRCVNSRAFQQFSHRITAELGKRYGKNPAVIGWQLDNEVGHYENSACYCESCHRAFIASMEDKYGTVEELNRNWAGNFWSQNYECFEQIELPNPETLPYLPNEHCLLDFKTFFSRSLSRFLDSQSKTLREFVGVEKWITHNFMKDYPHHFPGHVDSDTLDLYTLTIYPVAGHYPGKLERELHRLGDPYNIALNHDQMRSYNGRWGIMEQQPGQVNWGPCNLRPYPGAVRLWLWTAIAHGAELLDTYRYRQPLSGAEQYHEGITDLGGVNLSTGGEEFVQTAKELQKFESFFYKRKKSTKSLPKVGLITDWRSLTALSIHPQSVKFNPWECVQNFYAGFKRLGLAVDLLTVDNVEKIKDYSVICVTLVDLVDDKCIEWLRDYVTRGGHLILSPRNFTRRVNGHFPEEPYGHRFEQLTGAKFEGYDVMPKGHHGTIQLMDTGRASETIRWQSWAEQVVPSAESDVLAIHRDQFYKGSCAAFSLKQGEGRVSYIGFDHKRGVELLLQTVLNYEKAAFDCTPQPLPDNTLCMERGMLSIFLNYNDVSISLPDYLIKDKRIVLGSRKVEPAGVVLMQQES